MPTFNDLSKMTITSDSGEIVINGEQLVELFETTQKMKEPKEKWYNSKIETDDNGKPKGILVPLTDRLNPNKKDNQMAFKLGKIFDDVILKKLPFDFSNEFDTSIEFRNFANGQKNRFMREGMPKFNGRLVSFKYLNAVAENFGIEEKNAINQNSAQAKAMAEMLEVVKKSFETYMTEHANILKPSVETLEKYRKVYNQAITEINKKIEQGDYSKYDSKDKEGNITKKGSEADARKHIENIDKKMAAIDKAIAETNATGKKADAPMNPDVANADIDELKSNHPKNR